MISKLKAPSLGCGIVLGLAVGFPMQASAQSETTLIDVAVPDNFDRGRNQSVLEHPRPDYAALPILVGAFQVFPKVEFGAGATDNVYQTNVDERADAFFSLKPSVVAQSDWALHGLELSAGANLRRFADETPRDLSLFAIRAAGRLNFSDGITVYGDVRFNRENESAQTGAIQLPETGAFSTYDRSYFSVRGERQQGQSRITLAYDHTGLDFAPIKSTALGTINQATRNRVINRVTGRVEYAFTPSVAFYGQGSFEKTDYSIPVPGLAGNRDSEGGRILGGVSFDLAGLMRGKIGLGYAVRDYKLAVFGRVSGFSADAKIEYFPTELTTVTFAASRTIEDTAIASTSAFYDTRSSVKVDHELLRNLLLHGLVQVVWQDYLDAPLKATNYRVNAGAEYFSNRNLRLKFDVNWYHRKDNGVGSGNNFYEKSAELNVAYLF